ncbi:MAG TPA: hypothetical protein VF669_10100 [Tepidisphaeraceae bacterium]|jgi:hypothetical protein
MGTNSTTTLDGDEAEMLRVVLSTVVVEKRTGQIGIVHGAERFVSTQVVLKKEGRALLDKLARKVGLPGITLVDR